MLQAAGGTGIGHLFQSGAGGERQNEAACRVFEKRFEFDEARFAGEFPAVEMFGHGNDGYVRD